MPNLKPDEIQVRPVITSSINKQPMVKVLLFPRKDALERRFDEDFGEGKWSWYLPSTGVWTLEAGGAKQSVPEDPVEASQYSVNTYNKVLFVRAARNLGYGRELESAPEIKIFQDDAGTYSFTPGDKRWKFEDFLLVQKIEIVDNKITELVLIRDRDRKVVFTYSDSTNAVKATTPAATPAKAQKTAKTEAVECAGDGTPLNEVGKAIAAEAAEKAKKANAAKKQKSAIVEVTDVPVIAPVEKKAEPEKPEVKEELKVATMQVEPEQLNFDTAEAPADEQVTIVDDSDLDGLIGELTEELNA